MRLAAHYLFLVLGGAFGLVAVLLVTLPGLAAGWFFELADHFGPKPSEPELEPVKPDYESKWELEVGPDGSVSVYRNGLRYTTQTSRASLDHAAAHYMAVVPPEVLKEMRSKLRLF